MEFEDCVRRRSNVNRDEMVEIVIAQGKKCGKVYKARECVLWVCAVRDQDQGVSRGFGGYGGESINR